MVKDTPNPTTLNLNCSHMRLRDDLIFVPQIHLGQVFYHIECVEQASFYRIGYAEYVFVSLLDGETSFAEALALTAQRLAGQSLSTQQATTIYLWLLEKGLGSLTESAAAGNSGAGLPEKSTAGRSSVLNPLYIKISLGNPDRWLRTLLPAVAWLFTPAATAIGGFLILAAVFSICLHWQEFSAASEIVFSPRNWFWMTVAWLALKVVHELAHAFACRRYGGEVREMGVALMLLAPLAYVDVTSSWRLASKWSRIQVALAGMYIELLVAAVAALLWQHTESKFASHMLYNVIVMASASTILFNANPLMRFDGYFVLSDLLEIPNLYAEGAKTVNRHVARLMFGRQPAAVQTRCRRGWWIGCYGWAAVLWRIVLCVSLSIAVSVLFHGAGVALSILIVSGMIGAPAVQLMRGLYDRYRSNPFHFWRAAAVTGTLAATLAGILFGIPSPATVAAPGVVELQNVQHYRSLTGGFVREIFVTDGQRVEAGQRLLRLENLDVSTAYHDLWLSLQQAEVKYQVAVDRHEATQAQIAQREIAALNEQMAEIKRRFDSLDLRATAAGTVMARSLALMEGTYVGEGTSILSIGSENSKEVVIAVEQRHFDSAVPYVGQSVRIRAGSQPPVTGTFVRLEPRASARLPHPAMSAVEGGPLEVVHSAEQGSAGQETTRLAEPRFRGVVAVPRPCAGKLASGQRAQVTIGSRNESLGVSFYRAIRDWIEGKLAS